MSSSPTKIGECLAAGLPVVATDVGDVKDLLQDSRAGLVLEEFTDSAYRSAADDLADDACARGNARSLCRVGARATLAA
jgi:glycosyltransferase involved in cell wall biosynthesis